MSTPQNSILGHKTEILPARLATRSDELNFRLPIPEILEASSILISFLQEVFIKQYRNGRKLFLNASGVTPHAIPDAPEFTLEQALAENWLPRPPDANSEGAAL
ncbi:DUF29 family protein [Thermosynechococcus sp.]|uniref:DUF29 family protein n=1 Tax=Thermosynechococcus sp. TaxID=2814275 RepID=UPI002632D99A|nr:DUF29 family protein [Thermosynechococcus sp.]